MSYAFNRHSRLFKKVSLRPNANADKVLEIFDSTTVSKGNITGAGNATFSGTLAVTGATTQTGALAVNNTTTITAANASALTVGPNGATNPTVKVDTATASAATGLQVKSAAAAAGLAVSVVSSGANEALTIDAKGSGTITLAGTSTGAVAVNSFETITSVNANALAVGANGTTNPVLKVDASTGSVATGVSITGAAAAGGVAVAALSSGANEAIKIDAKGSGAITLGSVSTGNVNINTADKLTVATIVVPQHFYITFVVPAGATAADYDGVIPLPDKCELVAVTERHQTAGADAGAVTLMVTKVPSGTAKAAGTDTLSAGINLKAVADTNQSGSLHGTAANYQFAAGDGVALVPTGTLTSVDGVTVTCKIKRTV